MTAWHRHVLVLIFCLALASCGGIGPDSEAEPDRSRSGLAGLSCDYPDSDRTQLVVCAAVDRSCFDAARQAYPRVCWIVPTGASVHAGPVDDAVMRHRLECGKHWEAGYWLQGDDCV